MKLVNKRSFEKDIVKTGADCFLSLGPLLSGNMSNGSNTNNDISLISAQEHITLGEKTDDILQWA